MVLGPLKAEMAGNGLTVTLTGVELAVQPNELDTTTLKVPEIAVLTC
jgi:hypothetical protein